MTSEDRRPHKRSALVLLRTPLQAWVASQVLKVEGVAQYDLLYFTHNDASEDRRYFHELAADANEAKYCHVPVRGFDILAHLDFYYRTLYWRRTQTPDMILLASIDAPVINALATVHNKSELVTFDDGLANILPSGTYHLDTASLRMRLYRTFLGATDLKTIKKRIARHYTIYPDFENIVEKSHLRYLDGWRHDQNQTCNAAGLNTYFIGQPYQEALRPKQISALETHLRTMDINYYVRHPRERTILDLDIANLDKQGLIAEDAILRHAQGHPIHLVGWFSTVMFNLAAMVERSTMLLFKTDPSSENMADLARRAGCEIVII